MFILGAVLRLLVKNLWEEYKASDLKKKNPLLLMPQIGSFCYFVKDQVGSFHCLKVLFFKTICNFMANEVGEDGENQVLWFHPHSTHSQQCSISSTGSSHFQISGLVSINSRSNEIIQFHALLSPLSSAGPPPQAQVQSASWCAVDIP